MLLSFSGSGQCIGIHLHNQVADCLLSDKNNTTTNTSATMSSLNVIKFIYFVASPKGFLILDLTNEVIIHIWPFWLTYIFVTLPWPSKLLSVIILVKNETQLFDSLVDWYGNCMLHHYTSPCLFVCRYSSDSWSRRLSRGYQQSDSNSTQVLRSMFVVILYWAQQLAASKTGQICRDPPDKSERVWIMYYAIKLLEKLWCTIFYLMPVHWSSWDRWDCIVLADKSVQTWYVYQQRSVIPFKLR